MTTTDLIGNGLTASFPDHGENRLVEVRDARNTLLATYTYDGQGRRAKRVTNRAAPQGASEEVYLYDGWNRVATYDASSGLSNTETWGRDLSGTLEGAGGVGGSAWNAGTAWPPRRKMTRSSMMRTETSAKRPLLVARLRRTTRCTRLATKRLFDRQLRCGRSVAISTKLVDAETGHSDDGHRYYNQKLGRWLNCDPLGG